MPSPEQRPVTFQNANGRRLFGILHVPSEPRGDAGVILINPGIKGRVGPHRLYVKLARHYASLGLRVLRFDAEGLGDAEGHIQEALTADVYGSFQVGRLVNDTVSAMDWMQQETGISSFILSGLCGGAITGLLTGSTDPRVKALHALGMPVIMDGSNIDHGRYMTRGQLENMGKSYIQKLFHPKAWLRLLTFRSDYRVLMKSVFLLVNKKIKGECSPPAKKAQPVGSRQTAPPNTNLNPHLHDAFMHMVTTGKVSLIFSGADRLYWEFQEKYYSVYNKEIEMHRCNFKIYIIDKANHIFSLFQWQNELFKVVTEVLNQDFQAHSKKAEPAI